MLQEAAFIIFKSLVIQLVRFHHRVEDINEKKQHFVTLVAMNTL